MVDSEDSSATPRRISDDDTVGEATQNGTVDADVAQISSDLEEAAQPATPTTPTPTIRPSTVTVPTIQHENVSDDHWEGSELGSLDASSIDGLPRRAGSPAGSVGSAAHYAPSLQVRELVYFRVSCYFNVE